MSVAEHDAPKMMRNYRFSQGTLDDLDLIAATLGVTSRTDAIRVLVKREADKIRRKEGEK